MINGINTPAAHALRTLRPSGVTIGAPMASTRPVERDAAAAPSPASDLAAAGPPVDANRVAAIRTAIADGSYRIDPGAIADKMIDLDLPAAK